jgi:anti-sigma-K factor RskA
LKNCDQFRELFEGYALGVLDAEERAALEAHLATGCSDCAKSAGEARWLVSQLAYIAPDAPPPEMLKGRLMQKVRAGARNPRSGGQSKTSVPFWMWAGVAALFLVTLYSVWDAQRSKQQIRAANGQTADAEAQLAVARRENAILTDPASVRVALSPQNSLGPELEAIWHSQYGIVLTGQNVPVPLGNRVLQLWLIPKEPGEKPIPSLTLRPDANGKFVLLISHPSRVAAETKALAITEEPPGGSPQPTTTPRWVGRVG